MGSEELKQSKNDLLPLLLPLFHYSNIPLFHL